MISCSCFKAIDSYLLYARMDLKGRPWFDRPVARRTPDPAEDRELAELRQALGREERISRALREVGNALGTTLELDDLLELILGRLTDLLEADRSTLYLLDESAGGGGGRGRAGAR